VTDQRSAPERVDSQPLWFSHPAVDVTPRRVTLTRERVIAEALAIISADGVEALSMRGLATRLAVVPGAVYRHVRNKEELQDLVLDAVLGDVDLQVDPAGNWSEQVTTLAERLRKVLEAHRGIAGLLKTRAPLTPHSLALTEAFLTSLAAVKLPPARTASAYHLIYDFTLGFALSDHASPSEQRVRDETTRHQLHAFLRSLPADRFPLLTTLGEQVWADDRDQRFAANLDTLITGIQVGARP
jgi:AcrR family transcriptional regulator